MAMFARHELTAATLEAMATVADGIGLGIERRRAEEEVRRLNRDLEARVRLRTAALERANERLEWSNRELQEFASVASHDLQEPLRKVQAFGDRLEARCGPALGAVGLDYLGRMRGAAGRMRTLIDDLLAFSRVTTKALPFAPLDLGGVAREVASDLEGRLALTGGRIEIGDLPTVHADPTQMRQLLQNLIGNGLKFHRAGEPPVIRVRGHPAATDPGHPPGPAAYEILVEDNGIGFDEKYLDRIFNVFQRLHGRGEYEGTGMGLAICRKIAERHGGAITARSTPGGGGDLRRHPPVRPARRGAAPLSRPGRGPRVRAGRRPAPRGRPCGRASDPPGRCRSSSSAGDRCPTSSSAVRRRPCG